MSSRSTARGIGSLRDGVVVIEGDRILYVGPRFEGRVDETVEAPDRIVTPGLISTHAHIGGLAARPLVHRGPRQPAVLVLGALRDAARPREAQDEEGGPRLRRLLDGRAAARRRDHRDGDRHPRRVRGRARRRTTACASTWGRPSGRGGGSPATASASSGSGTRRRGAQGLRARGRRSTAPRRRPRRPRALLRRAVADRHLHGRAPPRGASAAPTRSKRPYQVHTSQSVVEFNEMVTRHGKTPIAWMQELGVLGSQHHPGPRHHRRRLVVDQLPGGRRAAHGRRGLLGGARGVGVRAPRRGHGVLRAVPRGGHQHVARHRHQSPERDRGDALGRGGLQDDGAEHGVHHRRPRLRRRHPRRRPRAAAATTSGASRPGPRRTSSCGRRARGG